MQNPDELFQLMQMMSPPAGQGVAPPQMPNPQQEQQPMPQYDMQPQDTHPPELPKKDFYENIANNLSSASLSGLASRLIDNIKDDKESRSEWESTVNLVMKYMGTKVKEFSSVPFMRACSAFDSTLTTALLNFYATARAELFPAAGPARSEIVGISRQETEDRAQRVKMFMNHYLTQIDKPYYPDSERLLMYVGFFGCAFKKVYQDPILNRPVARLITPQDFIVDNNTTDLMSSSRITQVLYLTRKDIMLRQMNGVFIEYKIPATDEGSDDDAANSVNKAIKNQQGINTDSNENKSLFTFYEVHVDLEDDDIDDELEDYDDEMNGEDYDAGFPEESNIVPINRSKKKESDGLPKPYIVTICEQTKKVVSITRNWAENDIYYARLEYFVHYYYQPGFGIYSLGLAHLMGSNAIAMTSILRQSIDAEMLAMFPGGLKQRGMRIENNDKAVGPAEFHEVETGGAPISDCIMLMPYKGSSPNALSLLQMLKTNSEAISAINNSQIPETGANTPVGTTLAMIEVANKAISSILRSLHVSLGNELKLLFKLFGQNMSESPYPFAVPGSQTAIMKQDFSDDINIVPVSDPNILTSTHRLLRAEALLKLAQSKPEIHDMREAYKMMYEAMNIENIDKLMPEPQQPQPPAHMDPLTEVTMLLNGKPIQAYIDQDHPAHIALHMDAMQKDAASEAPNQAFQTSMTAHVQEHKAFGYLLEMQRVSGAQMPPEQMLQDPQVQNAIASHAYQALMHQKQAEAAKTPQPLDPMVVGLADIEQRREASHLKHDEALMKTETEAYKAGLKFESEKEQRKTNMVIADEKNAVDLAINHIKNT